MKWGDQEIGELIMTLTSLVISLNAQRDAIDVALACIEQLDARTIVTTSGYQGLVSRIEKLENCTYGDGK